MYLSDDYACAQYGGLLLVGDWNVSPSSGKLVPISGDRD